LPGGQGKAADTAGLGDLPEWSLDDLYPAPGAPQIEADLERLGQAVAALGKSCRDKLAANVAGDDGGARLARAIGDYEQIQELLVRLWTFAALVYAGNMSDPANAKFHGDMQARLTALSSDLVFFTLELNRLDEDTLASALETPELAHYRPWLEDLRKERPHQLEDRIERLFQEKSITGRSAWNRAYDETVARLRFEVDGESLPLQPVTHRLSDGDRSRRGAAARALSETFEANVDLFALVTNTLAKDKEISDRWHGFDTVMAARNLANRVEDPVVEALVDTVRNAYPAISHRYYALKARWLGLEPMAHWDRNAPLPDGPEQRIPWSRARDTVLRAYREFAPEMADIAGRFFEHRWIDAAVRGGKAPGAFSHLCVPSVHPFVLLNYQGRMRDVMTLAHELGHGVHQVLAGGQGMLMAQTPLTLAETASVFGEMLTFRAVLEQTDEPAARRALLAGKIEDMINTVIRQIAFHSFEFRVHTACRKGELTAAQLGEIWLEVQRESLGPAFELGDDYACYWSQVPHFIHAPFYVYAYAFGDCLVNALYQVYQERPDGFADKYLDMLRAGGSKHHSDLLAPFGLDAAEPAFWSRGLSLISAMIDELEALG